MSNDTTTPDPAARGAEEGHQEHGLVMPFVPVVSKGGPYADEAYTAGWEMGQLFTMLGDVRPTAHHQTVHTTNLGQVDKLARYHGYDVSTRSVPDMPEYTYVDLVRVGPGEGRMGAREHLRAVPPIQDPDGRP